MFLVNGLLLGQKWGNQFLPRKTLFSQSDYGDSYTHLNKSPLFNSIYNQFAAKKAGKTEELFRYHNTHDDTILTLRWALGFDDPGFEVLAGDGMAFELHEENGVFTVQVVYYHSLQRKNRSEFREVLHLRDCPYPCTFDKFFEAYERWTPEKWETECHIPS